MGPRCSAHSPRWGHWGLQTESRPRDRGCTAFSPRILLVLPPSVLIGSPRVEQPTAPDCNEFFRLVNSELVGAGCVASVHGRSHLVTEGWSLKIPERVCGHIELSALARVLAMWAYGKRGRVVSECERRSVHSLPSATAVWAGEEGAETSGSFLLHSPAPPGTSLDFRSLDP